MAFITAGPDGGRGLLAPDRPEWPNRPPYSPPPRVLIADLRTLGKYAKASPGQTLDLALHHIVPWRLLRDFWNALAGAGWYEPLRDFAALFGRAKEQTKYWPQDMANGRFDDRHGTDDFAQTLFAGPWNLVRGPKHRTSQQTDPGVAGTDPGEGGPDPTSAIDDLSRGNGSRAAHVLAMVQVGRRMAEVVRATPTLDTIDYAQLVRDIARWQTLARHPLIEFDPAVWRIEVSSPDYTPGDTDRQPTHPRWNKRTRADG